MSQRSLYTIMLTLILTGSTLAAPAYYPIDISSKCNARLQSIAWGQGAQYPEGAVMLGSVPFNIQTAGGNNIWWARPVPPDAQGQRSIIIPINMNGITEVHTLINTTNGLPGPSAYACIEFFGSSGAYYRQDLIGNSDIRDYLLGNLTNNINGTSTINVFKAGSGFHNEVRLDKQCIHLAQCATAFATQRLDHIVISDWGGSNQEIFIAGITLSQEISNPIKLFVKSDASGSGTGLNWTDAFTQLSDAILYAYNNSDVTSIWVARGTYKPVSPGGSRTATFQLMNNLALYGGFAGNEDPATFNLANRDIAANPTILSGDLNGDDGPNFTNNAENAYHVVTVASPIETAVLDGFTIQGGNANSTTSPNDRGGGLYYDNGKLIMANCSFTGNTSYFAGGAMYGNGNHHVNLNRCRFTSNTSTKYGGAIALTNNFFMELAGCDFIDNSAPLFGGAICIGLPRMTAGNTRLIDCIFAGNTSSTGSGGAISGNAELINNCAFSGNSAVYGGAVAGAAPMINCELTRNTASNTGGGVYTSGGTPKLSNCILWNNSDTGGMDETAQITSTACKLDYCDVQGWTGSLGGSGNIGADPLFVDPDGPDNLIGTADDDFHLQISSPCIDAGTALAKLYYQAGSVLTDNTTDTGNVDLGYHYVAVLAYDGDGNVDSTDFDVFSACYNGPANQVAPDCYQTDFNNDHYVDAIDFDYFSACYNGPVNLPRCR